MARDRRDELQGRVHGDDGGDGVRPARVAARAPGRLTIIPQQALNVDCTVFFELYHASRESFTYLREFYVGELHPADRELVPAASGDEVPSQDFRDQLREFAAPWRFDTERVEVHKSF